VFTNALHSQKQAEEQWPQLQETFNNWYRWLLSHAEWAR